MQKKSEEEIATIFDLEERTLLFIIILGILIPFLWNISVDKNLAQQERFCSEVCGVNSFYITKLRGQKTCLCEQKSPGAYQTVSIPEEIINK